MPDLTEKKLHSEKLIEGVLLKAYRDKVQTPDGNTSVREWIDHLGASAVVPLFEDGTTMLVRQYRYPPQRTFLEVPAGKLDYAGEPPEEVAARELEEETGWKASRFTHMGSLYPCIGYSNEIIHFFLAQGLTEGEKNLSDGEFVENVILPFEEATEQARQGMMLDMKTAIALLFAENHLSKQGG